MLKTGPGIISAKEIPAKKIVGEIHCGVRKVISIGNTTGPPPHTNIPGAGPRWVKSQLRLDFFPQTPAVRNGMIHPWSKVSFQIVKAATATYLTEKPSLWDSNKLQWLDCWDSSQATIRKYQSQGQQACLQGKHLQNSRQSGIYLLPKWHDRISAKTILDRLAWFTGVTGMFHLCIWSNLDICNELNS